MKHYFTQMKSGVKWLLLPLLVLLLGNMAFSQNLINNGSMTNSEGENVVATGWTRAQSTPDINDANGPVLTTSGYFWTGSTPTASPDGGTWANLVSTEAIFQNVTVLAGRDYAFSFYYAAQPIISPGCCQYAGLDPVRVTLTGGTGWTALPQGSASPANSWKHYTGTITTTSTSLQIRFDGGFVPGSSSNTYSALDGVVLTLLPPACNAPSVTIQPTSSTICSGASTSFTGDANGTAPLSYQWLYNGSPLVADHSDANASYTGSTTGTLNITPTSSFFNGALFSLRVTNSCGTATTNAGTLTVSTPPQQPNLAATTQPTCASPNGTITINNYSGDTYTITPSTGVSQSGFTITAPAGTYTVTATNGCGTSASSVVTLDAAVGAPTVTSPAPQIICEGGSASFTGTPGGTGPFTYQWLYNGSILSADHSDSNGAYTGSTTATLNITPIGSFFNGASFSLRITNSCGAVTSNSALLTINTPPVTPTLSVAAQPTCTDPNGTIQINNCCGTNNYVITPSLGVTRSGFTITAPAGTYTVTAVNSGCSSPASSPVTLVDPTPTAPTLSTTATANACPLVTANIAALINSTTPAGATLEFYTSNTPIAANLVINPTAVGAGTYYAFYVNTAGGCYSPASAAITATITACNLAPDLTPIMVISPNIITGTTTFTTRIRILNLNLATVGPTTGAVITVRIAKNTAKWDFVWDGTLVSNSLGSLNNAAWTYTSNAFYHIWTTTNVIVKGSSRYIGFTGSFTPGASKGTLPISVNIVYPSGGETNGTNQTDVEVIEYSGN